MKIALSVRIALWAAVLSLAGVGILAYLSYRQHASHMERVVKDELAATVRNAAALFPLKPGARMAPPESRRMVEKLSGVLKRNPAVARFRLFALEGSVAFPIAESPGGLISKADAERDLLEEPFRMVLLKCVEKGQTCVTPLYSTDEGRWITAFAPLFDDGGSVVGILRADRRAVEVEKLIAAEMWRTMYYALAALAAALALGVVLALRVTRPVKRLYTAVKAARGGHFAPVEETGGGEIAELTHDFNQTHSALIQKMTELETLAADLEDRVRERTGELQRSYDDEKRARDSLQQEIDVARAIQETIIPSGLETDRVKVSVEYLPILGLGGDWGIVAHRGNGRVDIGVGDVTGHGVAAALVVNRVYTLMSQMCSAGSDLESLFKGMDFFLAEELADVGIYMTFMLCRLDFETMKITYVGAGHPPVVVYRPGEGIKGLHSACMLLGVGDLFCEAPMVRESGIRSGDFLILYTDGLIEAFDGEGRQFGVERLHETIQRAADDGACCERIAACLTEEVKRFTGGRLQDDVLVIVAEIS